MKINISSQLRVNNRCFWLLFMCIILLITKDSTKNPFKFLFSILKVLMKITETFHETNDNVENRDK